MEEKKKATAAHMRATAKYEKENYFKTLVRFNKNDEERIRAAAGKSLNGFIVKCVLDALDQERKPQNGPKPDIYEQNELLHQKQKEMAELRAKQAQEEEPKETEEERIERLKHEQVILDELKAKNGIVEQPKEFIREQSKIKASVEDEPPF